MQAWANKPFFDWLAMPLLMLPFLAFGLLLGAIDLDAPASQVGEGEGCNMVGFPETTLSLYEVGCFEDAKGNVHEVVFF